MEYASCLLFSLDLTQVALIRKLRPAWQQDKLNAIGGHIEPGERPIDAARRKVKEESGVAVKALQPLGTEVAKDNGWLHIFAAQTDINRCTSMTDEKIYIFAVSDILSGQVEVLDPIRSYIKLALGVLRPINSSTVHKWAVQEDLGTETRESCVEHCKATCRRDKHTGLLVAFDYEGQTPRPTVYLDYRDLP